MRDYVDMISARFSTKRGLLLAQVAEPLLGRIVHEAERRGGMSHLEEVIVEAIDVIYQLDICFKYSSQSESSGDMWVHKHYQDMLPIRSKGKVVVADLGIAAANYTAHPWMQLDYIDWCIVDSLVFSEWNAFAFSFSNPYQRALDQQNLIDFMKYRLLAVGVLLRFTCLMTSHFLTNLSYRNSIVLSILLICINSFEATSSLVLRQRKIMKVNEENRTILKAMLNAYAELDGAVLSPSRVRESLLAAQAAGAVWPTEIWPVLDSALDRDKNFWNVFGSKFSTSDP